MNSSLFNEIPFMDPDCPIRIHLIRRPKLGVLPGRHYGVAVEYPSGPAEVVDLVSGEGLGVQSLGEFLKGHNYEVIETLDEPDAVDAAWERLLNVLDEPDAHRYEAISRNCEHVARFVVGGERQSGQVLVGLLIGGVAVGLLASALRKAS